MNEQADFAHTLYIHHIPAPAIARVMERMIRGKASTSGENLVGAPDVNHRGSARMMKPPEYEP